jgi:hypothetical protein
MVPLLKDERGFPKLEVSVTLCRRKKILGRGRTKNSCRDTWQKLWTRPIVLGAKTLGVGAPYSLLGILAKQQ